MFKLNGILKDERIEEYPKSDGTVGHSRKIYVEPEGNIYPVQVNVSDLDLKIGKIGEKVSLDVRVYPFKLERQPNGRNKRFKAMMDVYIPRSK